MKKFLIALNIAILSIVFSQAAHAETPKKPVAEKKVTAKKAVKKHKKADGTKVAGTKPDTAPAKKPAKK
jgi:hypothetical protein